MNSRDEQQNTEDDTHAPGHTEGADERDGCSQESSVGYEEEYPAYLDLIKDLPPSMAYNIPEDQLRHIPEGNKDSGWQNCLNLVEKYDRELCQTYREQIDTLLVFAGLFSAVVTAFAVESYQWLQDDPLDTSVELLRDMVGLLSQNLNLTAPPPPQIAPPGLSGTSIARINSLWFMSLALSLSAALVGILCKQWLREFERNVGQSPEMALAVRHIRFQGIEFWKVGTIVSSVPIIMQMALALFIIGIVELLWRLHTTVACCVTVVAGLTLVFYVVTTLLPAMQYVYICARCCIERLPARDYHLLHAFTEPQCAFKSTQAWLVLWAIQPVISRILQAYDYQFNRHRPPFRFVLVLRPADSWLAFDINWVKRREHIHYGPRCAFESLAWIAENLGETHLSSWIWHCVWSRWLKNRDTPGAVAVASLEIGSVARSYPTVFALDYDNPSRIRAQALVFQCSLRSDLPIETALELFLRIGPQVGINSQWTREAVHAILTTYRDLSIHVSDGLAVGLFRMAELQTHAILLRPDGPNSATKLNAALAFMDILTVILRGSRLRYTLMAAMSGLALQWLRARPPASVALVARLVLQDVIRQLATRPSRGDDASQPPGMMFVAKLAGAVTELWPDYLLRLYADDMPNHQAIVRELLAMLSDEPSTEDDGLAGERAPQSASRHTVGGDRSEPPVPAAHIDNRADEDMQAVPHDPLFLTDGAPGPESLPPGHVRVVIYDEAENDAARMEIEVNAPASPVANPAAPANASPSHNRVSPDPRLPPS